MADDFSATTATSGQVTVSGTANGNIEAAGDRDWFAVELVAGRTYTIDLRGRPTEDGTLSDPYLRGIHDADGNLMAGTANDDGGDGYNSRVTFTASASATYYIAAGAWGGNRGTYEVEVTDSSPAGTASQPDSTTPADADATRAGATDLGDITALQGPRFPRGTLDGDADRVDYYRFTLTEAKRVGLGLRQQDADADLYLEDANGNVLYRSTTSGTGNERIAETLLAGTYYLRVESQEAGLNAHVVRYGVSAPDPDALAALQEQSGTAANGAPSFGQQGYAFDLAENADGSTNRVSLGTVAATDPEGATPAYRLVGGNESGSFEIDAASGELFYTGAGEDFESDTTRFTLTVRASDGSETADTTVAVNVTDVEETVDPPAADGDETAPQTLSQTVSEPDGEDFSADTSTNGRVAVGGTATGDVGSTGDRDWFAVELVAGRSYTIHLRGDPTGDGTLADPYLRGIHDADGNLIAHTTNDDEGQGTNSRVTFTATATGTHYIAAGAYRSHQGTYEVEVTDDSAADVDDDSAANDAGDDYAANSRTTGVIAVGETVTGEIETAGDRDWFAVRLDASLPGVAFLIRLEGLDTGDGTLPDPYIRSVYEYRPPSASHDGEELFRYPEAYDNDGGTLRNSFLEFEPDFVAVHFIEVTGRGSAVGTYKLTVVKAPEDYPSDTTTTGSVAVGGSVQGNIERGYDSDWFAVELMAGTTYRIDLSGQETGKGSLRDPYLYGIYDAEGNLVSNTADDDGGPIHDSRLEFTPDATGTYYISAGAYGTYWPGTGTYTLSVVEATDDHPADATTTGTVAVGGSATGHVEKHGDVDWYAVTLEAGITYRIDLEGMPTGGGTLRDPHLRGIYDANGNRVPGASDDDGGVELDSRMEFTPETSGTYYLAAGGEEYSGQRYPTTVGTYTLSVVEATDDYPFDALGTLEVGGSITGHIEKDGDFDWFAVTLEAGKTYVIDLKGSSTGDGTLRLPFIAKVWSGPDWAAVPGAADRHGSGEGDNSRVVLTPETDGTYYVYAQARLGVGTYTLTVIETQDDYSADTTAPGVIAVGGSARGEIETGHDRDWFAVTLEGGTTYRVDLEGSWTGRGTLRDPYLRGIHDSAGSLLPGTQNDNYGDGFHYPGGFRNPNYPPTDNSRMDFTPEETGTYYIAAGAWDDLYGTYTVSVSEAEDTL